MYKISEMAAQLGISRTALLYYEKTGLIKGERSTNGYRLYSEKDVQKMRLRQQLQAAGLSLKECKACVDAKLDRDILLKRLKQLDEEIAQKQKSRQLLAALTGEGGLVNLHESMDKLAPDAHIDWLITQGFSEKDAMRLKWLSKDMNEHKKYMADFEYIFEKLETWGPGCGEETLKALSKVPFSPKNILEIGCGNGAATVVLAKETSALITALDNHESALSRLLEKIQDIGLSRRVVSICAGMTNLPFKSGQFDLIWAEGSAYIMGVEKAMKKWRRFLKDKGVLVLSDMVWNCENPCERDKNFWNKEYPDMTTAAKRVSQAEKAKYKVIDTFALGKKAWENYYLPLKKRVLAVEHKMTESRALVDIKEEIDICITDNQAFNYQFFILEKTN